MKIQYPHSEVQNKRRERIEERRRIDDGMRAR